jgi:phosphoribosylglycinamide formyltransferase-1
MSAIVLRLGVLVSGRGTNLQAIIDASESGEIPAEVAVVVSNRPGALALDRARAKGIPAFTVAHKDYGKWPHCRAAYERDVVEVLRRHRAELIVCAGYDRLAGETLIGAFPGNIINIHPALLPSFPGLHAQADALAYGVKVTGATVFFVDPTVDGGPIIAQEAVRVEESDTLETLSARILEAEHRILPLAIALIAQGRTAVEGRRVRILQTSGGAS